MLTNHHRFHGHGSLRYLYKNGTAIRSRMITAKYIKNPMRSHSRFAVVVSKKTIKRAVGRNRVRRRIYEVVRLELPKLNPAHDVAIMVFSADVAEMPHAELTQTIKDLFIEADLYKK